MAKIGGHNFKADHRRPTSEKKSQNGKVSYEEFLDWADEDTLAEWVDGRIVMTSPASWRHQLIAKFLTKLLDDFSEAFGLGVIIQAPFQMKIPVSGREPDLLFIARDHLSRIQPTFLDGPADLAIEIISPESAVRDRQDKFGEYEAGKVAEYWLIDPLEQQAEFYQLDQNNKYQRILPNADGNYYSRELKNFWLKIDWLWQNPLPPVQKTLKKIGGSDYVDYLTRQLEEE